jgi:DNA-binding IclR family transcriptional regulator
MQRKSGATLDQLVEATGWLPHTTRAALTGLRKKGYAIQKSKNPEGVTVYRLDKDAAPESGAADPA